MSTVRSLSPGISENAEDAKRATRMMTSAIIIISPITEETAASCFILSFNISTSDNVNEEDHCCNEHHANMLKTGKNTIG